MTTLALKFDKKISWEWKEVFWTFWVAFCILIGMSFGICLMLFRKLCYIIFGVFIMYEIKGLLWFFFIIIGLTINSFLLVIGFIEYLDFRNVDKLLISF